MASPFNLHNKNARFADKNEVFLYTDNKSNGEDEEWLLGTPTEVDRKFDLRQNRALSTEQEEQILEQGPVEQVEDRAMTSPVKGVGEDDEICNFRRELERIRQVEKARQMSQSKERSTAEAKEREREEIRVREEQQKKLRQEEMLKQEQQRLEVQAERLRESERAIRQIQQQERLEIERQNAIQTAQAQSVRQAPNPVQSKRNQRVTMTFNEWLKDIAPPPLESKIPVEQVPLENQAERTRNSMRFGSRITMDLKGLSHMFQENFNKYEHLTSNRNKEAISRTSLGSRKSMGFRNSCNSNDLIFEQYFQNLEIENTEEDQAEVRFYAQLQQASSQRVRESEAKLAKLQEEVRSLEQELNSMPEETEEEMLKIDEYENLLQPLKYLTYKYDIEVLIFDINQHDLHAIYCEFILDSSILCKLKREDRSRRAEIRMTFSTILEIVSNSEMLIDMDSKLGLLKVYFANCLDQLPPYDILQRLGTYYEEFKQLEEDLSRCCSIFSVKSMELSRSCERLTFELAIKPQTNILVTIKLLNLLEPNYYEFYHIEARREILVPESALEGDDLIDILEAMLSFLP